MAIMTSVSSLITRLLRDFAGVSICPLIYLFINYKAKTICKIPAVTLVSKLYVKFLKNRIRGKNDLLIVKIM